jgi:hypothetical protein
MGGEGRRVGGEGGTARFGRQVRAGLRRLIGAMTARSTDKAESTRVLGVELVTRVQFLSQGKKISVFMTQSVAHQDGRSSLLKRSGYGSSELP